MPDEKVTVLLVDSNKCSREMLARVTRSLNYDVWMANNVNEALQFCEKKMPHCIVLDWNAPLTGGKEFLQNFRKLPDNDLVHLVVWCSRHPLDEAVVAEEAGEHARLFEHMPECDGDLVAAFANLPVR